MTTSPVHRQPPLAALLLSMVASMGDHQGHSTLPTAGARCECLKWMRVGDGLCPNSFRATGDNSTAYAGSFGDYNTATGDNSGDGTQAVAFAGVIGESNYDNTATATNTGTISGGGSGGLRRPCPTVSAAPVREPSRSRACMTASTTA